MSDEQAEAWWGVMLRFFAALVFAAIALAAPDSSHATVVACALAVIWAISLQAIIRGARLVGLGATPP